MITRPNATPVERAEGLLGLGEPKPRSRFWVACSALLVALNSVLFFRAAPSGGGRPGDAAFWLSGVLFLSLWALADAGGSLLHARRGGLWGRGLRVFGYAAFLPPAMGFYLAAFWFSSVWVFVVEALFVGAIVLRAVFRAARRTRGA